MHGRERFFLSLGKAPTNFDDRVSCSFIHLGVVVMDKVEYIHRQRTIPGTDFIYYEVFIRKIFKKIFGNKALGNGLTIVRLCVKKSVKFHSWRK